MQTPTTILLSFFLLLPLVTAHGRVLSPTPRIIGPAFQSACGLTAFNSESSDPNGNIQSLQQQAGTSFNAIACPLSLCKGYQFADQDAASIQAFSPGQTIAFKVSITAPHTGTANVSVVETGRNTVVGEPLISFTNYASTKTGVAANNTDFEVTMPEALPETCGTAGNCVLQWFWFSDEAQQTYISCVDFTSGSSSSNSNSSVASLSSVTTAVASSSGTSKATSSTGSTTSVALTTLVTATTKAAAVASTSSAAALTSVAKSTTEAASSATTKPSVCRSRRRR